jgi:alkylhydroperoxidase/carboxymuconolactone decarboxylase family protein YurZ
MSGTDDRRQRLKDEFTRARGYWSELWDDVLALDADFFEAYMHFSSVPWKHGPLAPKVKELVYIAIDVSTTHLYAPGTRIHIRNALKHGATAKEIMEVFELTSLLGLQSCAFGVPVLIEEAGASGKLESMDRTRGARQQALKARFVAELGYWSDAWEGVLLLSPAYLEAYLDLRAVPYQQGSLEPKVKAFVCLAADAATTHLYQPGIRSHVKSALAHGATAAEIMEVLELVSVLGIHSCTEGVPILIQELAHAKGSPAAASRAT